MSAISSSNSSSSSNDDYESDDCTTNSEGSESENEANSDDECGEDDNNEAIPRRITRSYTRAAMLFTDAPNPDAIDDELLQLHSAITVDPTSQTLYSSLSHANHLDVLFYSSLNTARLIFVLLLFSASFSTIFNTSCFVTIPMRMLRQRERGKDRDIGTFKAF
jgi:hypothetical protein